MNLNYLINNENIDVICLNETKCISNINNIMEYDEQMNVIECKQDDNQNDIRVVSSGMMIESKYHIYRNSYNIPTIIKTIINGIHFVFI